MVRCAICLRRLVPGARCPRDGAIAAALAATSVPAPPVIPGLVVDELLGAGGFAAVWSARREDGAQLAIKVGEAGPASSARLAQEAEALARVGPPHAPALFDRGVLTDGRPWLAMARLPGPSLASEMARWTEPPDGAALAGLGQALLEAAAAVHARGLVHRDLKPENVFLSSPGPGTPVVTLIDFGLTDGDRAAGTPEYMSPEQIAGDPASPASDVYTLGVVLYELFTARVPFAGDRRALEYAHLSFRPPLPSRFAPVPPALQALVLSCLAKQPSARFADAPALLAAFVEAARAAASEAGPVAGARQPASPASAGVRQRAALLFLDQPGLSPAAVQVVVQARGGLLAHVANQRCVCAFTHRAAEHPAERALAAARTLLQEGIVRKVAVDLGPVTIRPRPGGPPRLFSPLFAEAARYPGPDDPEGVTIAPAARESLRARERPEVPVAPAERPALQGRDAELAALLAAATRALADRRPGVAAVLGEGGMGKSRLALELTDRLGAAGAVEILQLHAREPLGTDADAPLAALLRQGLGLDDGDAADVALLQQRLGGEAQPAVSAAALLGWLPPDHPDVQSLRAAPGALRSNVVRAAQLALQRLAARRPVVVLLDDAHLADGALLDALEQSTVSDLPLWICAFARPAFADSRPGWGQRARARYQHRLQPLDAAAAVALCRALLAPADTVPQPVIDRLVERGGGVPLRLQELVRGLRRRGLVRQQAGGIWCVDSDLIDQLSDSPMFEWLATLQLEQLSGDAAAHARLLALLGAEFSLEEVAGVLANLDPELAANFPLDAQVGNARLQAVGMLEARGSRLGFATDLVREAIAASVGASLASDLHRAALAYYRTSAEPDHIRLPQLARHAAAAGARAEAAGAYLASAESARGRHRYLEADVLYTRALDQLDDADTRGRLQVLSGRGIVRYRMARHDDALADLAQARALAIAAGDPRTQANVMLDEATALDWLFEWQRSRELAERARDLVGDRGDPALQARVQLAIGRSLHRFNNDREAAEVLRKAAALAQACGDQGYEDQVAADLLLGFLLPFIGVLDEAEQRLARVEEMCRRKGDEMHLAAMWNNRSCLWVAYDDRRRFLEDVERVREYARRMGNTNLERHANQNTAYYLYWRGEYDQALPHALRMIEIDERYFRQGGFRPDGAVLLARIRWCSGDEDEARRLVVEVRAHQAAARAEGKQEWLLPPNDEMLLDMTGLLVEGAAADAWEALVARAQQVAQGQELIEVLELAGVAALRRGDRPRAAHWWRQALQSTLPNVMRARIAGRLQALG